MVSSVLRIYLSRYSYLITKQDRSWRAWISRRQKSSTGVEDSLGEYGLRFMRILISKSGFQIFYCSSTSFLKVDYGSSKSVCGIRVSLENAKLRISQSKVHRESMYDSISVMLWFKKIFRLWFSLGMCRFISCAVLWSRFQQSHRLVHCVVFNDIDYFLAFAGQPRNRLKVVLYWSICNADSQCTFFARICRHVTLVASFWIAFKNLQRVAALQIPQKIVPYGVLH